MLPPMQRAANGSTQPRPPPGVHAFDHAVAWGDYFPDVVGTALVNVWSTHECGFEHFSKRLKPVKHVRRV